MQQMMIAQTSQQIPTGTFKHNQHENLAYQLNSFMKITHIISHPLISINKPSSFGLNLISEA